MSDVAYKIVDAAEWRAAVAEGHYDGAPVDLADGYIHMSTQAQLAETARRHFHGRGDLLLLTVDLSGFGDDLIWEPSRGGDLFPHLYAPCPSPPLRHRAPSRSRPRARWRSRTTDEPG